MNLPGYAADDARDAIPIRIHSILIQFLNGSGYPELIANEQPAVPAQEPILRSSQAKMTWMFVKSAEAFASASGAVLYGLQVFRSTVGVRTLGLG